MRVRGVLRVRRETALGFVCLSHPQALWVSNSLSGRRWQLNQVPAVRCPPYVVEVRTGYRVSARHGERRVAVQGRVAPCRVVVGLEVGEFPLQIPPIPEEHLVQKFSPYRADQALYKGV